MSVADVVAALQAAIEHDIARAKQVIAYLTGDPIVNDFCAKHRAKPTYKELST